MASDAIDLYHPNGVHVTATTTDYNQLVDTAGDGVLVEFGSAVDAVSWSLQMQQIGRAHV